MRVAPFLLAFTAILACASTPPPAAVEPIDWSAVADEGTPTIVTQDADGDQRETPIWVVVLENQGYIRTGSSRWFANVERDPDVVLQIGGRSLSLRAELLRDDALRETVNRAFREKYGFWDFMVHPRGAPGANIMRLVARPGAGTAGAR